MNNTPSDQRDNLILMLAAACLAAQQGNARGLLASALKVFYEHCAGMGMPKGFPQVNGVGRDAGNERSLIVQFDRRPRDHEMRTLHDALRIPTPWLLRRLVRDAARYRALRNAPLGEPWGTPRIAIPSSSTAGDFIDGDDADAAVDALIESAIGSLPEREGATAAPGVAPLRPVTDAEVAHVSNALRAGGWDAGGGTEEFDADVRAALETARSRLAGEGA